VGIGHCALYSIMVSTGFVHYILLWLVGHCACMHDTNNALHSMHSCLFIYLYLFLALDYLLIFCTFCFFVKMTR
jgi:hypothetical protein